MLSLLLITIVALLVGNVTSKQILSLPGYDRTINFRQDSGYLDGGNGRQLFYWLTGAQENVTEAPLVLWLNGGPGFSSLVGLFTENGPWRANPGGKTLMLDEFAWNKNAHVLYIDSPVNVGFSYNTSDLGAANQVHNDNTTVSTLYHALIDFFRKFPEMKTKKFYITGESYAGVYIPLLLNKILDNESKNGIEVHGAAISNGVFDLEILAQTRIEYAFFHAMIGYDKRKALKEVCCKNSTSRDCDYPVRLVPLPRSRARIVNHNKECAQKVQKFFEEINEFDTHHVISSCNITEDSVHPTHECYNPSFSGYLNDPDVRKAIHVPPSLNDRRWTAFREDVGRSYNLTVIERGMDAEFRNILEKHKFENLILLNGDSDFVCDFVHTERFLFEKLGYKLSEDSSVWKVGGKAAGLQYKFDNGLKYFTINGAGHFAPIHRPRQMLAILEMLLSN